MFAFLLGREYKLSIAEINTVFSSGTVVFQDMKILILDNLDESEVLSKANSLGGTIKIIKIDPSAQKLESYIAEQAIDYEGKFKYGISIFGRQLPLKKFLIDTKSKLKKQSTSSRFVNKDFKALSSAQIIGEKLVSKGTDYNLISCVDTDYIGHSIWVQDIKAYGERDWGKDRDMITGMLPPKLAQMMINIGGGDIIYDPFIGLGTVLIESLYMGNNKVYGSDLSDKMVEVSNSNIASVIKKLDIQDSDYNITGLNAKFIEEVELLKNTSDISIVTEGYLGEMMTKKNISLERIEKQRESLLKIYVAFFAGLKKISFDGTIVISFPFWELKGKYVFFTEVYQVLLELCNIEKVFSDEVNLEATKSGSLLYKRDSQLVGREIFKLTIK